MTDAGAAGDGADVVAPEAPPRAPAPATAPEGADVGTARGPAAWPTGTIGAQLRAGCAPTGVSPAWMWMLFAVLGFVGGQIAASVLALLTAAVTGHSSELTRVASLSEPPEWFVASSLVGIWIGFGGAAWMASRVRGARGFARDLGLRFTPIDLVGIPIGVAGQIAVYVMYLPVRHLVHNFNQQFNAPSQRLTGASHGWGFVLIGVLTVVGAPFFEELFFRGLVLRALCRIFGDVGRWVGPTLAIVVTGVLFGLVHAESLQLVGLAAFGIALSAIAYRTGRLGMGMLAHASFNLFAVVSIAAGGTLALR